jgi:hypothetical protein
MVKASTKFVVEVLESLNVIVASPLISVTEVAIVVPKFLLEEDNVPVTK